MMNIKDFKQQLKPYKAIIGFDYGEKRLGVAVSDLTQTIATHIKSFIGKAFPKILQKLSRLLMKKRFAP